MLKGFCRPNKMKFRRRLCRRNRPNGNAGTYASFLRESRRTGITVEAALPCAGIPRVCGKEKPAVPRENVLLHYKSRWEHRKAEVFSGEKVHTGTLALAAPDTLCVVSGECSQFVPLEQVDCIRMLE